MNRRTMSEGLCGLELCVQGPRVLGGAFHFADSSHILGNLTFSLPSHTFFSLFLDSLGVCVRNILLSSSYSCSQSLLGYQLTASGGKSLVSEGKVRQRKEEE